MAKEKASQPPNARMVDVGHKEPTKRTAVAQGVIRMSPATLRRIKEGKIEKGDPLQVARVAGIMAAKKTPELVPLCHPLSLTNVSLEFDAHATDRIVVTSRVEAVDRTGVEMEALTAVSVACLTIYDLCKMYDKEMVIGEILLLQKTGGKSGDYIRRPI